ncbi:hypothetical protein NBH00_01090 [Paraconexibacter antarcticus]|uniref:MatE family transporter n=1 Tax=Paraconexibacter antarcticus TaxID=2949664 RepID=A0ABY5DS15_9ACTN|nr:hypothetical protein [Paraconexibacter antarcticus]UTI64818.1 hypothetical protein NBH00_01090 [Paraconexibacter antarcticus]
MPDEQHAPPHDSDAREPLGPFTPDDESRGGSTPEVHDEVSPHDLPKDHPGRADLVAEVGEDGVHRGNVRSDGSTDD